MNPKFAANAENTIIQQELCAIEQIAARTETVVVQSCHLTRAPESFELRARALVSSDRFTKPIFVPGINAFRAGVPRSMTWSIVTNTGPPTTTGTDAADHRMQRPSKHRLDFDYGPLDFGVQLGVWGDREFGGRLLTTNGSRCQDERCGQCN